MFDSITDMLWALFTHPLMIICLVGWLIFATGYYIYTGCER